MAYRTLFLTHLLLSPSQALGVSAVVDAFIRHRGCLMVQHWGEFVVISRNRVVDRSMAFRPPRLHAGCPRLHAGCPRPMRDALDFTLDAGCLRLHAESPRLHAGCWMLDAFDFMQNPLDFMQNLNPLRLYAESESPSTLCRIPSTLCRIPHDFMQNPPRLYAEPPSTSYFMPPRLHAESPLHLPRLHAESPLLLPSYPVRRSQDYFLTVAFTVPNLGPSNATPTPIVDRWTDLVDRLTGFVASVSSSVLAPSDPSLTTSTVQATSEECPTHTHGSMSTGSVVCRLTVTPSLAMISNLSRTIPARLANTSHTDPARLANISHTDPPRLSDQPPTPSAVGLVVDHIFRSFASDPPPPQVSQRADHPVPRLNIEPQEHKLQTNKFYAGLFLANQSSPVYAFPYTVAWINGSLVDEDDPLSLSWGMAVSHTERADVTYAGPKYNPETGLRTDAAEWSSYSNPITVRPIILSARELVATSSQKPLLTTDSVEWASVTANLYAVGWKTPTIRFPFSQGAAFVTGLYNWATPLLQSSLGFQSLTYIGAINQFTFKYAAQLRGDNPVTWLIYVTPDPNICLDYAAHTFILTSPTCIQGDSGFSGSIQVAKLPLGCTSGSDVEALYDSAAGTYVTGVNIDGRVNGRLGSYTLSWERGGNLAQTLLTFALPHHLSSFDSGTAAYVTNLQLMTTSKGMATAVQGDSWTLIEPDLPIDMEFAPWSPATGSLTKLSDEAQTAIAIAGAAELGQNITAQVHTGGFYTDGKGFAKFAAVVYALHHMADQSSLAATGLSIIEQELARHMNGEQAFPLVYESAWGGVVSEATYLTGDNYSDFGNTLYNDHHFHYGYFVYTAAVVGYLHPEWLHNGTNKAWINTLVRDYANPVHDDPWFPFSRAFDWYHGHSWATGLFDDPNGKNQESSSEDTMASYAIKMWGQVIGDAAMMARGNLMLAVQARAMQAYYLYDHQNTVQPVQYIGNAVAGILFENKLNHTTWFGAVTEYIQGIHMIPILPFSTLIRTPQFVRQEWDAYFGNYSNGIQPYISQIETGWRGILMANLAIIDPNSSYTFFDNTTLNQSYLDSGASQTWYLAWSAALNEAAG